MSAALDKIKEVMPNLPPEELREVRELADTLLTSVSEDEREVAFESELVAEGFISPVRPLTATEEEIRQYRAYQPITVEGQPLSEMIIEERR
jgi:hypothetical protein